MRNYHCTVTLTGPDGQEAEVAVTYEAYWDPGKINGPPENCYPPEGELNVLALDPPLVLDAAQQEYLEDQCWDDFHGYGEGDD